MDQLGLGYEELTKIKPDLTLGCGISEDPPGKAVSIQRSAVSFQRDEKLAEPSANCYNGRGFRYAAAEASMISIASCGVAATVYRLRNRS